jgi:hypothetical protein
MRHHTTIYSIKVIMIYKKAMGPINFNNEMLNLIHL